MPGTRVIAPNDLCVQPELGHPGDQVRRLGWRGGAGKSQSGLWAPRWEEAQLSILPGGSLDSNTRVVKVQFCHFFTSVSSFQHRNSNPSFLELVGGENKGR